MKPIWTVAVVALAALAGCGGTEQLPGSELMGRFLLAEGSARGVPDPESGADCVALEEPDPLDPDCTPADDGEDDGVCSTISRIEKFPEANLRLPEFLAILSRNEGAEAFVTVDERSRDASWDGQVLTSTVELDRNFANCECDATKVVETLTLTLLSQSQYEALGRQCPSGALPSGAGVVPPNTTEAGFDAVFACGTLVDTIVAGEGCSCTSCQITYPAEGSRR